MPVIINDFEVVTDSPNAPADNRASAATDEPAPAPRLSPDEVARLLRQVEARRARLHAD